MINPTITNNIKETFSAEITSCIKEVQDNFYLLQTSDLHKYKPYCEKLLAFAYKEHSDYLTALAYFCLTYYYFGSNNFAETIQCALEGIKYQQNVHEYSFIARSYNILGLTTEAMGDSAKAVDYFLFSIDVSAQHQLDYVRGMTESNLADTFHRTNNNERALFYYSEACKHLQKSYETFSYDSLIVLCSLLCNQGYCLLAMNRKDEAIESTATLTSYLEELKKHNEPYKAFVIHTFYATFYNYIGDTEQAENHLQIAKNALLNLNSFTIYADDIRFYVQIIKKMHSAEELTDVLDFFISHFETEQTPFYLFRNCLEERIECASSQNDQQALTKYSLRLFSLYKEHNIQQCQETLRAEQLHHENQLIQKQRYELMHRNQALLSQSQHDALTRLPNRAYLNDYAETTFSKAFKNQCTIGVEILDIDYFKSINDTYGHIEGDRYLGRLAEMLHHIVKANEDVFAARYGGDEFVIIYYNKTNDEITKIMDGLMNSAHSIMLPSKNPDGNNFITLSQGCLNRIPTATNRLWDFLAWADTALYDVKKSGKNSYILRDNFK